MKKQPTENRKLVIANWKMHLNTQQASLLVHKLADKVETHRDVEVVLAPNFIALQSLSLQIDHRRFKLGAQDCYWRDEGAYTGEVSATMLRGLVDYVLVGHSERRHVFGETNVEVRNKVQAVLRNGMKAVLCVGETATQRRDKETLHVLHDQVVSGLANVTSSEVDNVVIAYEPVWAIGSGRPVKASDLETVVTAIRKQIDALYGPKAAAATRILYGGSVQAENCNDFMSVPGVDGLLVGGASLKAEEFASIVEKAHTNNKQKG